MHINKNVDLQLTVKQERLYLEECFSNWGPWTTDGPRRSSGGFGRKSFAKVVSGT
jgi:hypothetical protein